jgi:hypothetical protein
MDPKSAIFLEQVDSCETLSEEFLFKKKSHLVKVTASVTASATIEVSRLIALILSLRPGRT